MSPGQRRDPAPLFGAPNQRTPVLFDAATGGLRIGEHERRVDPSEPSTVYGAYLSLLYAVRGAKPGQKLPLRAADIEALLLIVGDDPDAIEQRLVGLMGCSPAEAKALSKILLRHRKLTATLGIAAGLSLGAFGVAGGADEQAPASASAPVQSVEAPAVVVERAPAPVEPARVVPVGPVAVPDATSVTAPVDSTPVVLRAAAAPADPEPVAVAPVAPVTASVVGPVVAPEPPAAPEAPASPVEPAQPDSAIDVPAFAEAPPTEIGGIVDPSEGHPQPPAPAEPAAPVPAPVLEHIVELIYGPQPDPVEESVEAPAEEPVLEVPAPVELPEPPAVELPVAEPVEVGVPAEPSTSTD